MDYAAKIAELRAQTGDRKRRVHVDWIGDGGTTVFQMPDDTFPILDDAATYEVKVNAVAQTEVTDYSLDEASGTITFVIAPPDTEAITIDSIAVYLRDEDWLHVINDVIRSLGDDFWKEFVDNDNLTTTASMLSLSLVSDHPNCIAVYDFQYRQSTTDNWTVVEEA